MKKSLLILAMSLLSTVTFADSTFRCQAPQNQPNAFLADSYAIVTVSEDALRFQQHSEGTDGLMRDYQYQFSKIAGGHSKVTGMMKFDLENEIKSYGDAIYTLYIDQALSDGKAGALIFAGHGYSWDWNFCKIER